MSYGTIASIAEFPGRNQHHVGSLSVFKDGRFANGHESGSPVDMTFNTAQDSAPPAAPPLLHDGWTRLSAWSDSLSKRAFDCICVLLFLPVLIPLMLLVAVAVRLTSRGPVLFIQQRMGRYGKPFRILKFRTMAHTTANGHKAVTTAVNQRFTPIGPFLRRWKLDEIPQLLNVLAGQMSLVGPRPKLPEHVKDELPCRPGITGAATIAFGREEALLAAIPQHQLDDYYHACVLPAKGYLDASYMAQATFLSDLNLIRKSVLRRWEDSFVRDLLAPENLKKYKAVGQAGARMTSMSPGDMPAYVVAVESASEGIAAG